MPQGVVCQNGLESQYFAISCPWGSGREKMLNGKQLRNFEEKLFGRPNAPPKVLLAPGNCVFSVFGPEILQVPQAVLGQNGLKPQYFAISCPWQSGGPKRKKVKKGCGISGRNFLDRRIPPQKSAPSTGKLCFWCFPPRPGTSLSAKGPKWAKTPLNRYFWPVGA